MQDSQLGGSSHEGLNLHERAHTYRDELLQHFTIEGASGLTLARKHSEMMDRLIVAAHAAALQAVDPKRRRPTFALAAVGTYGRERVAWKSSLSVLFITDSVAEKIRPIVEAMVDALASAGITLTHQVVSVSEAVRAASVELPLTTKLLDLRPLAGDAALAIELRERSYASISSAAQLPNFLERLWADAQVRHERFGGSVYLLEPEIKLGLGGLRDLDVVHWATRARWNTSDPNALAQLGVLSARDVEDVRAATEFLWTLRNAIHLRMGSRSDRLSFKKQEAIAEACGSSASSRLSLGAKVEALMSEYYHHARNVAHVSEWIVRRAKTWSLAPDEPRRDLGDGLYEQDSAIGLLEPQRLNTEPALALRMYAVAVERNRHVVESSRRAIAALAGTSAWAAALRDSPAAHAEFVQLVSTPRRSAFRAGSIVSELHDVGLLLAMIPEFAPLSGRVHHDAYHVYTVDGHALATIDRLRALLRGELAERHPLASRLAAEVTRPHVLCSAALLRDIGKAEGRAGHLQRGAAMAHDILARLGFNREDNAATCQLIRHQIKMYLAAVRRDLEDPATIAEFTSEGEQTPETLRDLYLLTVVGVASISPSSLTNWKAGMLDELYRAADAELRGTDVVRHPAQLTKLRQQLKSQWEDQNDARALDEFLDSMPERYVLTSSPAEIVGHARVAQRLVDRAVSAGLVPSRHPDVTELCVVTETNGDPGLCVVSDDRPGLLASITAAITAAGLEIDSAQIHSRFLPNGCVQAVDLFWVRSGRAVVDCASDLIPKIEVDLEQLISGRLAPRELLKRNTFEPATKHTVTEVIIDRLASTRHTVIEVLADDRPGLLFTIAQAFHELGVSVAVAKIDTEGSRASDVFYVNEFDGTRLGSEARIRDVRERILGDLSR